MSTNGAYETACLTRGTVPEWDNTYIEKYVPAHILAQMKGTSVWVDDDGFWWGFSYVFAARVQASGEPVVVMATKPLGQGLAILKAIGADRIVKEYFSEHLIT